MRRERRQKLLVRGAELRAAGEAVEGHQHAEAAAAERERHVQPGPGLQAKPARQRRLLHRVADQVVGQLAGGVGDAEAVVVGQQDQQRPRRDQCPTALGHELEDRIEVDLAGQRARDLAGRTQRGDGSLELVAAALQLVDPPGVVDPDRGVLG